MVCALVGEGRGGPTEAAAAARLEEDGHASPQAEGRLSSPRSMEVSGTAAGTGGFDWPSILVIIERVRVE